MALMDHVTFIQVWQRLHNGKSSEGLHIRVFSGVIPSCSTGAAFFLGIPLKQRPGACPIRDVLTREIDRDHHRPEGRVQAGTEIPRSGPLELV